MSNKIISNCSITIPHFELLESGIPKEFHHVLKYRNVTREEAYELVGYEFSGWVVLFCDPKGYKPLDQYLKGILQWRPSNPIRKMNHF